MASSCGSSYASSLKTTNYARMCRIVVDVLRDILWQVLTNEILPVDLPQKVRTDKKKLRNLDLTLKTWLCGISSSSTEIPSAEKFDVTSLYTLIRNLCSQVPAPSTKWGQTPPAGGVTLGDDIERVREFRNTVYGHATQAKIENAEFNKLCIDIKDVVCRFDKYFCSKAMKCDFECEIDNILTYFMDKSLEDAYIEKMKEIANLADGLVVVTQQVGELMKKVDGVRDAIRDLQKGKDKVDNTTDSLVNEEQDRNENAGNSHEDIAIEMPQGKDGKIYIIKCYADLKLELERDIVMDIAKELFKKKKHKDVLEDLRQAGTRRICVDRLLKRVLKLKKRGLKSFFDLLKIKCPWSAQKVAEIKITDTDRRNFTQVSKSVKMFPHRRQNGLKFEQLDVEFFQCHLQDIPEKVDKIADVLLSQFHISICNHSQLMQYNDTVKKIHALLEKMQSCHFDSDLEVQSMLGSSLYDEWHSFRHDGSRQGLDNQGIWHYLLERIQSSKDYVIILFRGLRIYFMEARRGSLILKFVTLDSFDVKLLKPETVKTKLWDMIKTLCPEYQDILKEPLHLTIFFKPLSNTDHAEIYFYLETRKEKEEFSCMKLKSHDKQYIIEEVGPVSLINWMLKTRHLDEDKKTKLVDLVSRKDLSRRKKMKILLIIVESLGNGYEMLKKYSEEYDTFLYDKVFKKHSQMMAEENPVGAQQVEFSYEKEGMQTLSSTWIDFTRDPKGRNLT
ncbi:hypothetical protein ACJMK2_009564 [Sinanodonta woodiana]|uniref:DZIP3-like HEPN domain-containing protein n=1 Tax=Sinanodonta woodiana TaxID=1069815 RepID=A0ABD3VCM1_SINWO